MIRVLIAFGLLVFVIVLMISVFVAAKATAAPPLSQAPVLCRNA